MLKDIAKLKEYDDGELEELRAYEVIEYLKDDILESSLEDWMKKVSIGGFITVASLDIFEVANLIANGSVSIHQASELLYNGRNNCFSIYQIRDYLVQHGFSIERMTIDNIKFSVRAKKGQ